MSKNKSQDTQSDWVKIEAFQEIIKDCMCLRTLRRVLDNRELNGAHHFCRKIGKRLILSPNKFYEWIENEGKIPEGCK